MDEKELDQRIQDFVNSSQDAARQMAEYADIAKKLGLQGIDAKKKMLEFAEGVKKTSSMWKKSAKEINDSMVSLRKSLNDGETSAEELSDELEDLRKQINKTSDQDKKQALLNQKADLERLNAQNKATEALKSSAASTVAALGTGFTKAAMTAAKSALSGADSFEVAGSLMSAGVDIINSANQGGANALKSFGAATAGAGGKIGALGEIASLAGSALGALSDGVSELAKAGISFMIGQTKQLIAGFNTMSAAGAIYAGGMTEMISTAQKAGMTLDQFSKAVSNNTSVLAKTGLNVGEASKRMAGAMEKGGAAARDGMYALGMSMEDQATAYAQTMSILAGPSGQLKSSNAEVAAQTQEYAKNLKIISDITGEDIKSKQEKIRQENDTLFMKQKIDEMEPKQRARFNDMLLTMNDDQRRALAEKMKYGGVISKDLAASESLSGGIRDANDKFYQAYKDGSASAEKGRKIQADSADQIKRDAKNQTAISISNSEMATSTSKVLANAWNTSAEFTKEGVKAAEEAAKAEQEKGKKGAAGPEVSLQETQQQFALALQNLAADNLPAFATALGETQKAAVMAVDALNKIAGAAEKNPMIAGLIAALPAILGTLLPLLFAKMGARGATPLSPMYTKDVGSGGGGPDLSSLEKEKGGKGLTQDKSGKWRNEKGQFASKAEIAEHLAEKEAKQAGGVMSKFKQFGKIGGKALGIAGAVAGLGIMAKDLYDTSKDTKLTAGQKHEKEGGIAGEGLGGAGGAWAGAALGAANPVALALDPFTFGMGSLVGGAIGGALGYWGGSKLGGMAGKAAMKDKPVPVAPPSPSVQNTAPKPPTPDHAVTTASAALATTQAEEKARKDAMATPAANLPPGVQQQIELLQQILTSMLKNNQLTNGILQHSM